LFLQQIADADELRHSRRHSRTTGAPEVIRRCAPLRKHELGDSRSDQFPGGGRQLISRDASLRGVSLSADLPQLPQISGDRFHLQQVLLNLILTAWMRWQESRVNGGASPCARVWTAGMVELAVIDQDTDRAGQVAASLPAVTTKPNGMGMGLSIAHTIIAAHHGRIWAENNPRAERCSASHLSLSGE
jgi:two-component system sensor kinase FixL